ncbi:hypothetical protein AMTR_s00038p00032370 [Amborella trichopoda]|uniref:Uncharacterized protein n=1 Tax=Amborella trichopoda TaxID=13333 RepID=U5CMZ0_AMBTC|nr:hypothetical protein AMTR_s00038p00032370 [Amborella trichopoda]
MRWRACSSQRKERHSKREIPESSAVHQGCWEQASPMPFLPPLQDGDRRREEMEIGGGKRLLRLLHLGPPGAWRSSNQPQLKKLRRQSEWLKSHEPEANAPSTNDM